MRKLDDYQLDGIDHRDYPDFVDAFVSWATWEDGTELTDDELDKINEDGALVHQLVWEHLF